MSFLPIALPFMVYNLLQAILIVFMALFMLVYPFLAPFSKKLQRWKLTDHFGERLGFIPRSLKENIIWIHAASVGELFSAQPLIEKLKLEGKSLYVTTSSLMGRTLCIERKLADYCSLIPFDALPSALMAFSRIKPQQIIIVENDLWPNLLMLAHLKGIKVTIVNGIVRERSHHFYKALRSFFIPIWKTINHWFVQTDGDRERLAALGLPVDNITITGTTKSVNVVKKREELLPLTIAPTSSTVIIFASMHEAEVPSIITALTTCNTNNKNVLALLVPRHKGWEKSLETALTAAHFSWKTVTENALATIIAERTQKSVDALIILEAGVLFNLYAYADIAFVGGTLNTIGGHNITEPAVWGNAIIAGPHLENHADILPELKKHHIITTTSSPKDFETQLPALCTNKEHQKENGAAAQNWVINDAELVQKGLNLILVAVRASSP